MAFVGGCRCTLVGGVAWWWALPRLSGLTVVSCQLGLWGALMECHVLPLVIAGVLEYGEGTVHGEGGGWHGRYSCVLPFY